MIDCVTSILAEHVFLLNGSPIFKTVHPKHCIIPLSKYNEQNFLWYHLAAIASFPIDIEMQCAHR